MRTAPLGKTGLTVTRTALGCLPLQRRTTQEAVELIQAAYEAGITLYDTARGYTDSEYKLGLALEGIRDQVVIATKTQSELTPVFSPRTFGARMFPSICWMTRIQIRKGITFGGSVRRITTAEGITPMKGPIIGTISVIATVTAIRIAYGMPKIEIAI